MGREGGRRSINIKWEPDGRSVRGSVDRNGVGGGGQLQSERNRERQTDRQTDRQTHAHTRSFRPLHRLVLFFLTSSFFSPSFFLLPVLTSLSGLVLSDHFVVWSCSF